MTKQQGMTVIELIITIGMMTVLFGAIMAVYLTSIRAYNAGTERSNVRAQLSQAMDQITRDLQKAQSITLCNVSSVNNGTPTLLFTFNAYAGAQLTTYNYIFSGSTLERSTGEGITTGPVIATGIQPPGATVNWSGSPAPDLFSCTNGLVTLDMTAVKNGTSVHLKSQVRPRNMPVGLAGWWTMGDVTTSTGNCTTKVADYSGNGNSGTCSGNPPWTARIAGVGALSFNGSGQFVSTSVNNLPTSDLSIAFWANASAGNGVGASHRIFGYENSSSGTNGLAMYFSTDTAPMLIMRNNGTSYDMAWGTISTGSWYHYAVTISSTAGTCVYLNGVLVNANISATAYSVAGQSFHIGTSGDAATPFIGSLNDVRVYNRALSVSEVAELYNGG